MQVSYEEAITVFESIKEWEKVPSLHPDYVVTDAQRDNSLIPIFFIYKENSFLFYHAVHKVSIKNTGLFDFQSPYGYGGPIFLCDNNDEFITRASKAYEAWCRENNILAEFIRFHPKLNHWQQYYGEVIADRETIWIDLNQNELLSHFSTRARTAVRKAVNDGLTVEWSKATDSIYEFIHLYNLTMKVLGADNFYFFNEKYFEYLFQWDYTHLLVCKYKGEVIAAATFLIDSFLVEYHLSASNLLGKKLNATNLLLYEAAEYGKKVGCSILHLGGGTDNKSDNPLLFFKSGFSKNSATFRIGKKIFNESLYYLMKSEWEKKKGGPENRILFYRF